MASARWKFGGLDDWLETVEEEADVEEEDGEGYGSGRSSRTCAPLRWAWRRFTTLRESGDRPPEMERMKALRQAVLQTTSALSAPFLHLSAYLVRDHFRAKKALQT